MKTKLITMMLTAATLAPGEKTQAQTDSFKYTDEQFADIQMLRYKVEGFEKTAAPRKNIHLLPSGSRPSGT